MKEVVLRPTSEGWKALRNAEGTGGEIGLQQLRLLHNMTRTVREPLRPALATTGRRHDDLESVDGYWGRWSLRD